MNDKNKNKLRILNLILLVSHFISRQAYVIRKHLMTRNDWWCIFLATALQRFMNAASH